MKHYTWLARRRARACFEARRFVELAGPRQSPEPQPEEATRCCCCGCVLGGSSCPSPTSPTSGVRHELRVGPLLHRLGGDPGLTNPPIPVHPPSLPCAPFSSSSCEFLYAAAVYLAALWRTVS
ncbi:hypothetical protein VPH35_017211 [Triticum aestivum]